MDYKTGFGQVENVAALANQDDPLFVFIQADELDIYGKRCNRNSSAEAGVKFICPIKPSPFLVEVKQFHTINSFFTLSCPNKNNFFG